MQHSIHHIHNGAQNHQVEAGQASSFKFCKFAVHLSKQLMGCHFQ